MHSQITTSRSAAEVAIPGERSNALVAAVLALVFGIGLVFTTGFAHPSAIHNAAHDTRHALSFPCH